MSSDAPTLAIDSGHTAWMLVSMALVQLMLPGLAFFYAGLLHRKSVVTMIMQNYGAMGVITIVWFIVGYSLCFSADSGQFFGNPATHFFFRGVDGTPVISGIPTLVFAGYQGMFAVITPALMTGAFADRIRFAPYLVFIALWIILVYAPFCHWVWGGGWMARWGVWDFAGGIVVHTTAGFSALAAVHCLGSRMKIAKQKPTNEPHNIPFVALGTALLWFGWFGFNGGSHYASGAGGAFAAVNSEIAASTALFVWMIIDWIKMKKPSLVGVCVGAIAGNKTAPPACAVSQAVMCAPLSLITSHLSLSLALLPAQASRPSRPARATSARGPPSSSASPAPSSATSRASSRTACSGTTPSTSGACTAWAASSARSSSASSPIRT